MLFSAIKKPTYKGSPVHRKANFVEIWVKKQDSCYFRQNFSVLGPLCMGSKGDLLSDFASGGQIVQTAKPETRRWMATIVYSRQPGFKVNSFPISHVDATWCKAQNHKVGSWWQIVDVHRPACLKVHKAMWFQWLGPWWRILLPFHWWSTSSTGPISQNDILQPILAWRSSFDLMRKI